MYKKFKKRTQKALNTIDENATMKVPVSEYFETSKWEL